jgi:hypothetical protein
LEDAIFAAVGVLDDTHKRRVNIKHAEILMRIVIDAENVPTLTATTLQLTDYYGAKSKQTPPFALGWLDTVLGRLAVHYGLAK